MIKEGSGSSQERTAAQERSAFEVAYHDGLKRYTISGGREALLELGCKLYVSLGGSELSPEECRATLEDDRELRPRAGIFGIRMGLGDRLEVDNRNRKTSDEMNSLLQSAVEAEMR
ncbi:hypothetical protein EDM68_01080 [Candidatus Uhrbacteria bacterium]|nr:MAG: hypothetical protein EDM68_01080 [Candidatus Uhrbacteria bacterium]